MVCLDEFRILRQNLFELDHCHVLVVLPAVDERLVVFADGLVDGIQLILVRLQLRYVQISGIVRHVKVLADHPFAQGRHHLAGLKIHQTQQIPGCNVFFIHLQASVQAGDGAREIPHLRFFQPLIVQQVGNADNTFL